MYCRQERKNRTMTKVDIVSGFLGAGKTTLIKKLIKDGWNGQKIVLIENEFGEIGIDGGFLKDAGIQVTEMNSGCICCTLVGDFGKALKQVVDQYAPDRIIIEPSGVGKLSDVIKAVQDVAQDCDLEVNDFVAVVDAKKAKIYMKNFGEFFNNQIENAKTIILSRTQMLKQDKLEEIVALIREHNSKASIITTPWDDITGSQILAVMDEKEDFEKELLDKAYAEAKKHQEEHEAEHHHHDHDEDEHEHHHHDDDHDHDEHHHDHDEHDHDHEHHHHHHADDIFDSWGQETPHKYTDEGMKAILDKLAHSEGEYGTILRAKGIVPSESGEWIHFDLTPGEYEVRHGSAEPVGRLCVIGAGLRDDELKKLFEL